MALPASADRVVGLVDQSATRPVTSSGSAAEFDDLFQREFTSMVGLARAICGDHEQGEDLAQEAFTRAHRHWHKVGRYDRPGAWVRRVTINLALSRRRRLQRELSLLRRSAASAATEPAPFDRGDPAEMTERADQEVWAAVRQLPPRQRAAIALFYQQDLSTSDIADAMGCSVSTATSHLNQARSRLAATLDESMGETESTERTEPTEGRS
jgi:RNA polymerase sigma factor (sigma-70 family)